MSLGIDHTIAASGDLVLELRQEEGTTTPFSYRVDSGILRQNSRYFENLLSDRFHEGQLLSATLESLKNSGYSNAVDIPVDWLPRVAIVHLGRISKVSTIENLAADFFRVLHNQELSLQPPSEGGFQRPTASLSRVPSLSYNSKTTSAAANTTPKSSARSLPAVANLANLAVVADRFDALPHFARYIQRKKYLQAIDAKTNNRKTSTALPEERVRQKLLVGLFFDHSPWVTRYSKHLIMRDSKKWRPGVEEDDTEALWWDIPNGVEDELVQRREYILETINSLQTHFLKLYTSGERQCKLGYDSSIQCDSFQLGEMVRFFTRLGTLRLQGLIYDATEPTPYSGDIERLLESLRQSPAYQIDRNHAHCGLKSKILPLLDLIQNQLNLDSGSLDIGLCAECWHQHRELYAWSLAKRPITWTQSRALTGIRTFSSSNSTSHSRTSSSCLSRHMIVRDMFMAVERDWSARDAY